MVPRSNAYRRSSEYSSYLSGRCVEIKILPLSLLSTPSARRATLQRFHPSVSLANFYPRPPRGGRQCRLSNRHPLTSHFYPRPPRGGRQSRESLCTVQWDFYPRPPRGGRPVQRRQAGLPQYFYPRPPRGGRQVFDVKIVDGKEFLSTPSARRATS